MADDIAQKITAFSEIPKIAEDTLFPVVEDPDGVGKKTKKSPASKVNVNFIRTPAEIDASVTPTDLRKDPGNVLRYGVTGDGSTDDTTALQAIITAFLMLPGGFLFFPDGTYKITDELTIPKSARWRMYGESRGGTIIRQATNNKPIFRFEETDTHSWTIETMTLDYTNQQAIADTLAIPFFFPADFGTAGNGYYNFVINDIHFDKCFRCIAHDASKAPLWGYHIDKITVGENVVGSFIYIGETSALGSPNGHFGSIYILADSIDVSENIFDLIGCSGTTMDNVEINNVDNGSRIINASEATEIFAESFKVEVGSYSVSGAKLFNAPDSRLVFGLLKIQTLTITAGGTNPVTILGYTTGTHGYYRVGTLTLSNHTITSGILYVADAAAVAGNATRRVEIDFLRPAELIAGIHLTDLPATGSAAGVRVNTWAEPRISDDKGDANVTVGISDSTIIRYSTALTANRTVTLPSVSAAVEGSSFNGLTYWVMRIGLGDFRLDVLPSGGSVVDGFPPNTAGVIGFTFRRFAWEVTYRYLRNAVGADNGDAAATLTVGQSSATQRWSTALTADRAVTLSTTGAVNGDRFKIVRSATGAFNLNVGTGPLKALAVTEWCVVEFDGSAWFLAEFGAL